MKAEQSLNILADMSSVLSKKASQRVYEIIKKYETDKRYEKSGPQIEVTVVTSGDYSNAISGPHAVKSDIPAPSFAELIRILPKIGEKLWNGSECTTEGYACDFVSAYMSAPTEPEGMAAVEKYLMDLLK